MDMQAHKSAIQGCEINQHGLFLFSKDANFYEILFIKKIKSSDMLKSNLVHHV